MHCQLNFCDNEAKISSYHSRFICMFVILDSYLICFQYMHCFNSIQRQANSQSCIFITNFIHPSTRTDVKFLFSAWICPPTILNAMQKQHSSVNANLMCLFTDRITSKQIRKKTFPVSVISQHHTEFCVLYEGKFVCCTKSIKALDHSCTQFACVGRKFCPMIKSVVVWYKQHQQQQQPENAPLFKSMCLVFVII